MKFIYYLLILIAVPLLKLSAYAEGFDCQVTVAAHDNPNAAKGDFSATIKFSEVALTPNMVGFGASAKLADEITIVDGHLFLVRAGKAGLDVRHQPHPDEGAAVLVSASPIAWKQADTVDGVSTFDGLAFALDNAVEDSKCGDNAALPFKIVGHAKSVHWTVVNGSDKEINNASHDVDVIVVGVYAKTNKEHLHMVKGYNLHAHVYLAKDDVAGHIQDIDLADGGELYFPGKQ
jgi:hypothetical protein